MASQKSGIEKKKSESPLNTWSVTEPRRETWKRAMRIPKTKAPDERDAHEKERVRKRSAQYFAYRPLVRERPAQLPVREGAFTYLTNCSGSGRSRPYCARSVCRTVSLTFGLSITALNGSPGAR